MCVWSMCSSQGVLKSLNSGRNRTMSLRSQPKPEESQSAPRDSLNKKGLHISKMMRPCIYRVPSQIRDVKPEAYIPRMVLIGPLHLSVRLNPWHPESEYKKMEVKKHTYYKCFTERVSEDIIEKMRRTVKAEETNIRASYADPLELISSDDFVELILRDSIFIMEFIIRLHEARGFFTIKKEESSSHDLIVDHPIYTSTVTADLILLENQLPYFILERLFGNRLWFFGIYVTLDRLILESFSLHTKIKTNTNFDHLTDMFRCVYEESLDQYPKLNDLNGPAIVEMNNAESLSVVGVKFKACHLKQDGIHRQYSLNQQPMDLLPISIRKEVDDYSLHMSFNKGCLVMPSFRLDDPSERILRNVIAYEQCHVTTYPFTSNYIHFMNFLITKDRDVEVLTAAGVLMPGMGTSNLVVEMVNNLNRGLAEPRNSQYHILAMNLRAHYKSRRKRYWATLNRVYFSDLWTGTASMAAILLLFLTLVGTVASVVQAYKSFK